MIEMRFIDLFCGVGGFHHALHDLGHKCILAADIDKNCREIYNLNWNKGKKIQMFNDVEDVVGKELEYDILCAGGPVNPLVNQVSKWDLWMKHGNLVSHHFRNNRRERRTKTKGSIFRKRAQSAGHDGGNTIKVIKKSLRRLGYEPYICTLSPHQFGVPQHRPRVFIVAINTSKVKKWDKFEFQNQAKLRV